MVSLSVNVEPFRKLRNSAYDKGLLQLSVGIRSEPYQEADTLNY